MIKGQKILLIFTFFVLSIKSQTKEADSIKAVLQSQKEDTNKVRSLIAITESLEDISNESALKYAKEGLALAKKINYKRGEIFTQLWYARILTNLGKRDDAQIEFDKIRKITSGNESQEVLSDLHYGLGLLFEKQDKFEEAISNYSICIEIRKALLNEAKEKNDFDGIKRMKIQLGNAYLNMGDASENYLNGKQTASYYKRSIELLKGTSAKKLLSFAYNNIGLTYLNTGDYNIALENHFEALKIKNELKDTNGIARTYHNIGNVYFNTGDYKTALKNFYAALQFDLMNNNIGYVTMLYGNIGVVHEYMGDLEKALENYRLALYQTQKTNDKQSASSCYINMANILIKQGDELLSRKNDTEAKKKYNEALENQQKALKIYEMGADDQAMATLYINMGALNQRLKKHKDARQCYMTSLKLSRAGNHKLELSYTYGNLAELDSIMGDYKGALSNYKQYIALRDSMINEESSKKIIELQMQSDFDKKETEARLVQEKKDEITQNEITHQKQQRNLSLIGVGLFAIMAIFIFRGYKQKQKANVMLEEKNELIATQKHLVEEKNREITDSINYAKRLQKASLASEKTMRDVYEQSFILYKPKDIVSGDFYWILRAEDKLINKNVLVFAAADCTGHGVPGAFMSMLNSTLLNQTAYNPYVNTPADALNFLNQELPKNLRSPDDTENINDGMDIAFCWIDVNKKILKFAGANNPCWVIRDNELIQLKPTKQAITASTEYEKKKFANEEMQLKNGDCIYLFTDGYADQFGGPKGKKFKYKTLGDLLLSIKNESSEKQKEILDQKFMEWKGELEQVDDVLLMGIKIT